jgi:hypothetical protein
MIFPFRCTCLGDGQYIGYAGRLVLCQFFTFSLVEMGVVIQFSSNNNSVACRWV